MIGDPNSWWKILLVSSHFLCANIARKKFLYRIPDLVRIYTPKEAHSRIFVNGGQYSLIFAQQKVKGCAKNLFLGRLACLNILFNNGGRKQNPGKDTAVVHRQRRYGDAARARRRESWSNQVRKRGASPRKHSSSDGD